MMRGRLEPEKGREGIEVGVGWPRMPCSQETVTALCNLVAKGNEAEGCFWREKRKYRYIYSGVFCVFVLECVCVGEQRGACC